MVKGRIEMSEQLKPRLAGVNRFARSWVERTETRAVRGLYAD
jgi:hypothetical protein